MGQQGGEAMGKGIEIPDCRYAGEPQPWCAPGATRRGTPALHLSNLDDQRFLRFSIKYLHLYRRSVSAESLRASLARVLEDYYPLAGRLRGCGGGEQAEGAVFAEASVDLTAEQFLAASARPNWSWRKLLDLQGGRAELRGCAPTCSPILTRLRKLQHVTLRKNNLKGPLVTYPSA